MQTYVKICPNGHVNPEHVIDCESCPEYLGMISPVPAHTADTDVTECEPVVSAQLCQPSEGLGETSLPDDLSRSPVQQDPSTQKFDTSMPTCYLQAVGAAKRFTVHGGDVLGQVNPESGAQLQLSGVPGANCIHSQHCRFGFDVDGWHITTIDQKQFGREFTNPTKVNLRELLENESAPLSNGDHITLAGVSFLVRIP